MKNKPEKSFLDVILTRSSVRDFKVGTVSLEDLRRILQAGIMAPSAGNRQPWRFHVIRGETKRRFAQILKNSRTLPPLWKQLFVGVVETVPVVIIVENTLPTEGDNIFALLGTAASIENMLLAVHSLGYGSVWVGFPPIIEAAKEITRPSGEIVGVLPIGHPAEHQNVYVNRSRKPLEEVTKFYD